MAIQFSDDDLNHLRTFPQRRKTALLREIMARQPKQQITGVGHTVYDKTVLKLRNKKFGLIDFQPMETACTTIWYRKSPSLLGVAKSETIAMLIWESNSGSKGDTITLNLWQLSDRPLQW